MTQLASSTEALITSSENNTKTKAVRPAQQLRAKKARMLLYQIIVGVILLALWQLGSTTGVLDTFFFSEPTMVFSRIVEWFATGSIYTHLIATTQATLLAFIIGVLGGMAFGVLFGRVDFLAQLFDPFIKMINALPRLVLAPIFLLWFGIGIGSKVALAATLVFFVVFFNTLEGMRSVPRVLVNNSKMLGASEWQLLKSVYLPSAVSWIFSSLHTSVGFAITGAVIGEYLGAFRGIGYVIAQAQGTFDTTSVFAGMVVLMVFVLIIEYFITLAEKRLLRWRAVGTN
ncbi:ABC transporter permease [Gulosibacter sp. ACHW.36C]|uniref:ABC transporter permease n=1 Tax=Gulosibacter sediminis TaxID=1729695 RepID=A0ABY4MZ03_9MICO|nr:ABC transporter permease [Gulosibacter sediminis]UQN14905.1 ABC transporter permease [Gulosibacter sediminis]